MEHYDLRSCFLPNMSGLQLRMYQFTQLLGTHLPELAAHLNYLGIQPTYASQWFLSFFAVTCPLPMLFRIYDVIFAEGAPETIMRVALSLMRRNQKRLLASSEFEDVMQMLLARGLWDTYNYNANDLVQDFVGFTGVVTREALIGLERRFKEENPDNGVAKIVPKEVPATDLQAAASRFLGRIWGGSSSPGSVSLSPSSVQSSRPASTILMKRTPSKQSLSTVSSYDASDSSGSTEATTLSRCSSLAADDRRMSTRSISSRKQNKDGELHGQIEDLLMALSQLQREHAAKVEELLTVKAERDEDRQLSKRLVELLGNESRDDEESVAEISDICDHITETLTKAETENASARKPSASTVQLQDDFDRSREQLYREQLRSKDFSNRLAEQDSEISRLKSQLLDARSKWQESQKEKQQLQKQINDLKHPLPSPELKHESGEPQKGGLRELRLGRSNSTRTATPAQYNKRSSSLGMHSLLASQDNNAPATADALLLELVASKTAEAVAKQEAEEARAKLETLRKVLGGGTNSARSTGGSNPPVSPGLERVNSSASFSSYLSLNSNGPPTPSQPANNSSGGFWGGWGKKTAVDSR